MPAACSLLLAAVSFSTEAGSSMSLGCEVTVSEVSKQLGVLGPRRARPPPGEGTITPHGHTTIAQTAADKCLESSLLSHAS